MMKGDQNHCEGIPFDVSEAAAAASNDLLSCKSKDGYERAFQIFEDWRREKKLSTFTEEVFVAYFAEKASLQKPSSLWSMYSMLKSVFLLKQNLDIDKFLLEPPDKEFLLVKVVGVGVSGACRCDELSKMLH
ncbi:hypothetical protein Zmor_023798 [Zophobas morio]|uniref:Uncharacterized protein n=1 Tax=Zophobas morio TaxID=2755281 RepID=A0AA38HZW9_9CUCU|nr:hypothetical protein Zmor_023798 [Zophobas morio]